MAFVSLGEGDSPLVLTSWAVPKWTEEGGVQADPGVLVLMVVLTLIPPEGGRFPPGRRCQVAVVGGSCFLTR
ncbi:hypothetical protein, partial [Streptomyces sp. NPDC056061]|uniref:hypothetical protein n=1 Tax=Streptomyces sp. NPDC056061 TaxID=3345700 RepID=UPI0035E32314